MDALAGLDIAQVQADNPGPFTLQGTNTWLVGRDPCWVVDPGPALDAHVDAVLAEPPSARRDRRHRRSPTTTTTTSRPSAELRRRAGDPPVAGARFAGADVRLGDGDAFGPLRAIATPGHAPDHLAFLARRALFSGDAVLGHGSVFVWPDPGALRGYLAALERLAGLDLAVICPGHGPLVAGSRRQARRVPRPPPATASGGSSHALDAGPARGGGAARRGVVRRALGAAPGGRRHAGRPPRQARRGGPPARRRRAPRRAPFAGLTPAS